MYINIKSKIEFLQLKSYFIRKFWFFLFIFLIVFSFQIQQLKSQNNDSELTGKLLVSDINLRDPNFYRSVIFIVEHSNKGSVGLIINRFAGVVSLKSLGKHMGIENSNTAGSIPIHIGGPVQPEKFFALHTKDFIYNQSTIINDKFAISPASEVLESIIDSKGPSQILFALGYSGWAPKQLADEISTGSWHVIPANKSIIFSGHGQIKKWESAIEGVPADL